MRTPCMVDKKPASPACVKAAVGQDGSSLSSGPQKFLLHPDRWGLRAGRAIVTGDGCGEGGRHPLIRRGNTWKLAQTAHVGGSRINLQPTSLLLSPNTNTSQNTDAKLPNRNSALAGSFQNLMGTKTSTPGSWMIQITEEYLVRIAGNQIPCRMLWANLEETPFGWVGLAELAHKQMSCSREPKRRNARFRVRECTERVESTWPAVTPVLDKRRVVVPDAFPHVVCDVVKRATTLETPRGGTSPGATAPPA